MSNSFIESAAVDLYRNLILSENGCITIEQFFDAFGIYNDGVFIEEHDVELFLDAIADIKCYNEYIGNDDTFKCSECGAEFDMSSMNFDLHYCPHCGCSIQQEYK